MTQEYQNFIAGEWVPAKSGARFERENPATGEPTGSYPRSGPEDVKAAVCAAQEAAKAWRRTPAPRRGEILFRAAEILVREKERFARESDRRDGQGASGGARRHPGSHRHDVLHGRRGARSFGQTTPSELPDKFAMSVRAPVGVVGCITPWNFPMAIPSWKLMPALVTGNTVVFKPSQFSPKSAYNLVKALDDAGIPPGVVNLVFGEGAEVGSAVVDDPAISLISFTGSNAVGQSIGKRCAELGKTVSLEMGGKNAIIVMDDADIRSRSTASSGAHSVRPASAAPPRAASSCTRRCTTSSLSGWSARAERLRLGNGLDESTDVGPVVNQDQLHKIDSYMSVGRDEGARLACGGATTNVGDLGAGLLLPAHRLH